MLRATPFRWHFAPLMTLFLRYLLIVFAFSDAFSQYSTTNTDVQCAVQSVFFCATNVLISTCAVLAMAWRTNAVVRGVVQTPARRLTVQSVLATLTFVNVAMCWVFLIAAQFSGSWSSRALRGVCTTSATSAPRRAHNVSHDTEFWYYVVSIVFDAYCALAITVALRRLATHSQGFSKLIQQCVDILCLRFFPLSTLPPYPFSKHACMRSHAFVLFPPPHLLLFEGRACS